MISEIALRKASSDLFLLMNNAAGFMRIYLSVLVASREVCTSEEDTPR